MILVHSHYIGGLRSNSLNNYMDGYMAELNFIDGGNMTLHILQKQIQ